MRVPIEMQQLGPEFELGVIIEWHKQVGDNVEQGDLLLEVETEKLDVDVAALSSGTLVEIAEDPGSEVRVGDVIGYLEVVD